jgi:hypothetical protein
VRIAGNPARRAIEAWRCLFELFSKLEVITDSIWDATLVVAIGHPPVPGIPSLSRFFRGCEMNPWRHWMECTLDPQTGELTAYGEVEWCFA